MFMSIFYNIKLCKWNGEHLCVCSVLDFNGTLRKAIKHDCERSIIGYCKAGIHESTEE